MLAALTSVLALSALASAAPAPAVWARDTVTSLPYNFTLAALNTTLPNANTTGAPLVIAENGGYTGTSLFLTATEATYPNSAFPSITLSNGVLSAGDAFRTAHAGGFLPSIPGTAQGWASPGTTDSNSYSVVDGALAWAGEAGLWKLCPSSAPPAPKVELAFNVSTATPPPSYTGFDVDACYDVKVNIVPL